MQHDPDLEALAREKLERVTGDPSEMEWFTYAAKEMHPLVEADLSDLYRRPASNADGDQFTSAARSTSLNPGPQLFRRRLPRLATWLERWLALGSAVFGRF
jgi:hypothetical protein